MKKYFVILLTSLAAVFVISLVLFPVTQEKTVLTYRFTCIGTAGADGDAAGVQKADDQLGTDTRLIRLRIFSDSAQASLIRSADYSKVDGLITAGEADSPSVLRGQINQCVKDGIPVILTGEDMEQTQRTAYVGPDHESAGAMAAQILIQETACDPKHVLLIVTSRGSLSQMAAAAGFQEELEAEGLSASEAETSEETAVTISEGGSDRRSVRMALHDALEKDPSISQIYCISRASSEYTGDILKSDGYRTSDFQIVASGMSSQIWQMLQEGRYAAALVPDDIREGYRAVELLKEYLETGKTGPQEENTISVTRAGTDFDFSSWQKEREEAADGWELF